MHRNEATEHELQKLVQVKNQAQQECEHLKHKADGLQRQIQELTRHMQMVTH